MDRANVLVVFYSRTGHTRKVAEAVAKALHADLEELHDRVDRRGVLGYLRSGAEALFGVSTELAPPRRDPRDYDLVVVGSPVWNMSLSTPVRTWLWLERPRLPRVAFFLTLGGVGEARVLGQMKAVAAKAPVATLVVREGELARGALRRAVAAYAEALGAGLRRGRGRKGARAAA